MFTMHQVEVFVESAKLVFIFGFILCMVLMITNHKFSMKTINGNDADSERFLVLRKQLSVGLGLLLLCFLAVLMIMNFFNNWYDYGQYNELISSDPDLMREAINKVFDAFKILIIFCFVSIGVKIVLLYREQVAKLRNSNQDTRK